MPVQPYLFFNGRCEEALNFYKKAIGAEVTLAAGATRQLQVVTGGVGFASENDRRLHFGLGATTQVDSVVIRWPSGTRQIVAHPAIDQFHVVREP